MKRWSNLVVLVLGLLCATAARAGDDAKVTAAAARARNIANRLQAALDPDQCRSVTFCKVTMAAGVLDNGKVVIATSEDTNRLRSPVKAIVDQENAEIADGQQMHAEQKVLGFPSSSLFYRNRKVLAVAAGRPICERCERAIVAAGAKPASACESGRRY